MDDNVKPEIEPVLRPMRLSVSEAAFRATGTARIRVTRQNRPCVIEIPIQSVDASDVMAVLSDREPRAPKSREFDDKSRKWISVLDLADPDYLKKQDAYQRAVGQAWAFMGIALDICDEDADNEVVWSADNETKNFERCVQVFRNMGVDDQQYLSLVRQIRALTGEAEEELDAD